MTVWAAIAIALAAAPASGVDVRVTLTPPEVPFHRQAVYSIAAEAPAGMELGFPSMTDNFGGVPASQPQESRETLADGRVRTTVRYVLDPVRSGTYAIKPATVEYGEGQRRVVPSPVLKVRDLSEAELKAVASLAPNEDLVAPARFMRQAWPYAAGGIAALALAVGLCRYLRRRSGVVQEAPKAPAWETALERLRTLDAQGLPRKGQFGPYYVQLSSILRRYIEDRFALRAPERTTPEFLAEASGSGAFSSDHQHLLDRILRHADRVKFAQYQPTESEMVDCMTLTRTFVEETIPASTGDIEGAAA